MSSQCYMEDVIYNYCYSEDNHYTRHFGVTNPALNRSLNRNFAQNFTMPISDVGIISFFSLKLHRSVSINIPSWIIYSYQFRWKVKKPRISRFPFVEGIARPSHHRYWICFSNILTCWAVQQHLDGLGLLLMCLKYLKTFPIVFIVHFLCNYAKRCVVYQFNSV